MHTDMMIQNGYMCIIACTDLVSTSASQKDTFDTITVLYLVVYVYLYMVPCIAFLAMRFCVRHPVLYVIKSKTTRLFRNILYDIRLVVL
jgi:hypothetical protein